MTEKIKCTLTCELIEIYLTREDAIESLNGWDHEGEQYIVIRNMFPPYKYPWAVYQVITIGKGEVI